MLENTVTPAAPTRSPRLLALDGLRGLAILFVFINHLRLQPLIDATPDWLYPVWTFLNANGKAGVCIFFVLSGYWAVTLYRDLPNPWTFLQKRYARIFPALIVMCLSLAVIRFYWGRFFPEAAAPLIVIVTAYLFTQLRQGWGQLKISRTNVLFIAFGLLQIVVAGYYLLVLPQTPPAVFYQVWSGWVRQLVVFLVNVTMTLPLGRYIAQLDGVYWALTIELAFYLLYPWLILPFFKLVADQKSLVIKIVSGLLVFPFVAGLYLIFQQLLGFSIFNFYLFIFMLTGMVLGELNLKAPALLQKLTPPAQLRPAWVIAMATFLFFGRVWLYQFVPEPQRWLFDMTWTVAFFVGTVWALHAPALSRWLSHPGLVKLGTYSYVIYLTHTIAIEMFMKGGEPTTILGATIKIIGAIIITYVLSEVLYRWIETKPPGAVAIPPTPRSTQPSLLSRVPGLSSLSRGLSRFALPLSWLLVIISTVAFAWYGYRAPVSVLQPLTSHYNPEVPDRFIVTDEPQRVSFTATSDNLGMILMHLKQVKTGGENPPDSVPTPTKLQATVLNQDNEVLSTAEFQVMELGDSRFHPLGLPIQPDSDQHQYHVALQVINPQPDQSVAVMNQGVTVRSVYFPSKSALLRQPQALAATLWSQLSDPFATSSQVRTAVLLTLPFMLVMAGLIAGQARVKPEN